jgi:hypothetical protein
VASTPRRRWRVDNPHDLLLFFFIIREIAVGVEVVV